jgi:Family of unknown function (DUF6352)
LSERRDFWLSCGHHLLDRDANGTLPVTDEFLKAYLARPELTPPPEACAAERTLHLALLEDPRQLIAPSRVAGILDTDARENWELLLAWRDHLVRHITLEAAYLDIVAHARRFPHIFINQLVQVILRNVLDDCDDAFVLRAAELFFRPQKLQVHDGSLLCADEDTVAACGAQPVSPLISLLGVPTGTEVAVLSESNADTYWERSDAFDLALDLTGGRRGLAALGNVIARWVAHLLAVDIDVLPVTALRDVTLTWYLGLDSEATRMGDALWAGETLDEATQARLVGLYQLSFVNAADMDSSVAGAPTYLMMAMTKEQTLRLKPQNLVSGLPVRRREVPT